MQGEETFEVDATAEAALLEATAEADREDFVDAEAFLRSLGRGRAGDADAPCTGAVVGSGVPDGDMC